MAGGTGMVQPAALQSSHLGAQGSRGGRGRAGGDASASESDRAALVARLRGALPGPGRPPAGGVSTWPYTFPGTRANRDRTERAAAIRLLSTDMGEGMTEQPEAAPRPLRMAQTAAANVWHLADQQERDPVAA